MIQSFPLLLLMPFGFQAIILFIDEFYYHHKRGLPKWEILGHPLDTITTLAPIFYAQNTTYHPYEGLIYLLLCVFSCVFITKDELIHKDLCSKEEMILHALLFILHPMMFVSLFYFWQRGSLEIFQISLSFKTFAAFKLSFISGFLCYQIIYWRFIYYGKSHQQRHLS